VKSFLGVGWYASALIDGCAMVFKDCLGDSNVLWSRYLKDGLDKGWLALEEKCWRLFCNWCAFSSGSDIFILLGTLVLGAWAILLSSDEVLLAWNALLSCEVWDFVVWSGLISDAGEKACV